MSYFGVSLRNGVSLGLGTVPALSNPPLLYRLAPSLLLQFAGAETLDSRITFTRTTTATRTNSSGVIESVAINGPRFDYNPTTLAPNGLLIEEQRTNLVTYSEQFDNAAWSQNVSPTITANIGAAPDGTFTADQITATATNSGVFRFFTVSNSTTHTFSIYLKYASGGQTALIGCDANPATARLNVNTSTGAITSPGASLTAYGSQDVGGGWYRVFGTYVSTGTTNSFIVLGTASTNSFLVWGAQLEAGAFATSYIPTVASQVTRTADVATMTGTNFSSWYNATEGTMYAGVVSAPVANIAQQAWYISDNTSSNNIALRRNSGGLAAVAVNAGGVAQADVSGGAVSASAFYKFAAAYKVNDFAVSLNAGAIATDTSGSIPVVSQLNIGATAAGTQYLNGTIKQIAFYPRRLTNAELQAITS